MSGTPCEQKMLALAKQSTVLQGYLFNAANGTFRWFDRQLQQGYIDQGSCIVVLRVSTQSTYVMAGPLGTEKIRFQFDCYDYDAPKCFRLAQALMDWMATVDFFSDAQFNSPPATPPQYPNFQTNQRSGLLFQLGKPVYVETIEYQIYNNTNN